MNILSTKEAQIVDRVSSEKFGISTQDLMKSAGLAIAKKAKAMIAHIENPRVAIVCGSGNNGGDGFSSAIFLKEFGCSVTIFSTAPEMKLKDEVKFYYLQCLQNEIPVVFPKDAKEMDFSSFDLIVDALFGIGLKGIVKKSKSLWIEKINSSRKRVVCVDIPSGIDGDNGLINGVAVKAHTTVTFGFYKQGLVLQPGASYSGEIEVADIGFPPEAVEALEYKKRTTDIDLVRLSLKKPPVDTYKHQQGKVLIVGGSKGFTGAASLTAMGALRSGAGLVKVAVPESLNSIYETKLTEVISIPIPDSAEGRFKTESDEYLHEHLEWCDVLAIGPGLGTDAGTMLFTKRVLSNLQKPVVIDADALRVFRNNFDLFQQLAGNFILTPHRAEAALLTGVPVEEIRLEPFSFVADLAKRFGGVIVLKGAPTLIGYRKTIVANSTGHQGLATAGTGDVLTGMIATFVAQGMMLDVATYVATFVHGKAADRLLPVKGYRGMIASDLLEEIPKIISEFELP